MVEAKLQTRLRSIPDLVEAHEELYNHVRNGKIDNKTADALNTTLKGQTYLLAKLRLDAAKVMLQASIKKVDIPVKFLPIFE
jgi:hypothetical protein